MAEKKVTQKRLKIQHTVDSITRIEGFLAAYEDEQQVEVQPRLERLEALFEAFDSLSCEYEALDESVIADSVKLRAKVEEQYLRVKGGLVTKLQEEPRPVPPVPQIANQTLRLPTIELPKFDGNLNDWVTFHDSFNAIIHISVDITPIQKLQYLRAALRGDALKCIEALPISAANYQIAWDALLTRYQNKGLLKKKHLHGLTSNAKLTGKSSLGQIVEDFHRNVRILEHLGEPTQHWDTILIHLLSLRVDTRTLRDWEEDQPQNPTYKQFMDFLNKKIRIQDTLTLGSDKVTHKQPSNGSRIMAHAATEKRVSNCVLCNESHALTHCSAFENMNIRDRLSLVQTKKLCSNCLHKDHFARNCQSKFSCRTCNKRHHTWLHPGFERQSESSKGANTTAKVPQADINPKEGTSGQVSQRESPAPSHSFVTHATTQCANVFLSTVVLIIVDKFGREQVGRALLDSASQANLMSERLNQVLKLNSRRVDVQITGVNHTNTRIRKAVSSQIRSRITNLSVPMDFFVVNKVTNQLPASTMCTVNWKIPHNVKLADPNFNISRDIDMIIGAEHYYKFIRNGRMNLGPHLPILIESEFGWIVSGRAEISTSIVCHAYTTEPSIEENLERFWKIEELQGDTMSITEKKCEQVYKQTTLRNEEGRYVVTLPKHADFYEKLGNSRAGALRRFQQLENKFITKPDIKMQYDEFIQEYLDLGHMELDNGNKNELECYLPHHAVYKDSSTTTKVRVVFDGSAKTSTGHTLNELLLVGPVVQQDILAIAIRFRKHRIAIVADAEKMYRQVLIAQQDSAFQKILYRFDRNQPVQTYRLKTVTYGLSPSSFLATRTLMQLAEDEGDNYPKAKPVLQKDFYVDDLISGSDSVEGAIQLRDELNELLMKGGFSLRKWCSNSLGVLKDLSPEQVATQSTVTFQEEESIKTLGISWEPASDTFKLEVNINDNDETLTKRRVLSQIAQLFDPLGLIAPVILQAKVLMQQIWIFALGWDDTVPSVIETTWRTIHKQLPLLKTIKIDRYVFLPNGANEIHCFVDASTLGYGASIYGRSATPDGFVKIR